MVTTLSENASSVVTAGVSRPGAFRDGVISVGLLSPDGDARPRWSLRTSFSTLSVIGLLQAPARKAAAAENPQLTSATSSASGSDDARSWSQGSRYTAGLGAAAALLFLAGVAEVQLESGRFPAAEIGQLSPEVAAELAAARSAASGGGSDPSATSGQVATAALNLPTGAGVTAGPSAVAVIPTTPSTTVPDQPKAAAPLLQASVSALAGLDASVGLGLGDGTCTGLRLQTLVVGCAPPGRTALGLTLETSGTVLPALHVSVPE